MEVTLEARRGVGTPIDLDPTLLPGEPGYFSGEWLAYPFDSSYRFDAAYAGTLVGRWKGWAKWECTRDVAAAVVADQEATRRHYRLEYAVAGLREPRLSTVLDTDFLPMRWEGDAIVVDRRACGKIGDHHIKPNERGLYVVMGGLWSWEEVPADKADTVHGQVVI